MTWSSLGTKHLEGILVGDYISCAILPPSADKTNQDGGEPIPFIEVFVELQNPTAYAECSSYGRMNNDFIYTLPVLKLHDALLRRPDECH